MERNLAYAKDIEGNVVYIHDKKIDASNAMWFCPLCHKEVIPKRGDDMTWHFAHKDRKCGKEEQSNNAKLTQFIVKTKDSIPFDRDPRFFTCVKCRQTMRKPLGIRYKNDDYLCKDCYHMM